MHHPPKPKKQDQLLTSPLGRCPRKKYSSGPTTASLRPSALKNSSSGPPTAFTEKNTSSGPILPSLFAARSARKKLAVQDRLYCLHREKYRTDYCLHCLRRAAPKKNSSSAPTTAFTVCGAQRPRKNSGSGPPTAFTEKVPVQDQYCLHCSRRAAPEKNSSSGPPIYCLHREKYRTDYCLHCLRRAAPKKNSSSAPTTAFTVCGAQRPRKNSSSGPPTAFTVCGAHRPRKIAVEDQLLPSLGASAQEKLQFRTGYCLHCLGAAQKKNSSSPHCCAQKKNRSEPTTDFTEK